MVVSCEHVLRSEIHERTNRGTTVGQKEGCVILSYPVGSRDLYIPDEDHPKQEAPAADPIFPGVIKKGHIYSCLLPRIDVRHVGTWLAKAQALNSSCSLVSREVISA